MHDGLLRLVNDSSCVLDPKHMLAQFQLTGHDSIVDRTHLSYPDVIPMNQTVQVYLLPLCLLPERSWMLPILGPVVFLPYCLFFFQFLVMIKNSRRVILLLMTLFSYVLYACAALIAWWISAPRPYPECTSRIVFYQGGMPPTEVVYIIASGAASFAYETILRNRDDKGLPVVTYQGVLAPGLYSVTDIMLPLLLFALYPPLHYMAFLADPMQEFVGVMMGLLPTILFAVLLRYLDDTGRLQFLHWNSETRRRWSRWMHQLFK